MRSSYIQNNYGEVFEAIVAAFQPAICVELGVLDGYSSLAIGRGLKRNGAGRLFSYDLFDLYHYKHGSLEEVRLRVEEAGLVGFVDILKRDAFDVNVDFRTEKVSLLHVDISNTGETIKKIMELWDPIIVQGGLILFEGGTQERDEVEWMIKYQATPIKPEIESNQIIKDKYVFGTYLKFPGLTVLLKKRD
ncbi:class I SAM-dependent methyltransferase [Patescibacteria group bacterium]|uniref:Putative methyltransferase n=1 Tax=viral metagenome TaxID=1070528 RepID=A0A6M3ISH1_9ZZZZ|nr:class I SAM-dependent methyltransferase [Patescibacteria group bacterium]